MQHTHQTLLRLKNELKEKQSLKKKIDDNILKLKHKIAQIEKEAAKT